MEKPTTNSLDVYVDRDVLRKNCYSYPILNIVLITPCIQILHKAESKSHYADLALA